jgi:hypothetical protein
MATGVFVWLPVFRTATVVLLFAAFLLGSSAFTTAGRTAGALQFLRGQPVRVLAWGKPLPTSDGPLFVESIASLGVGLLIRLQVAPGASRILLKIAQPRDVQIAVCGATVGRAAYVQWASYRLPRVKNEAAPALVLEPVSSNAPSVLDAPAA